jgi:hypothetical protein
MRGAAATSAAHRSAGAKNNRRISKDHGIEAELITGDIDGRVKDEDKVVDPDYNEEEDFLYLFPPSRYQKGDISLGVLMSG